MEARRDNFLLTDDVNLIQPQACLALLQTTYWANKRTLEQVEATIRESIVVGLFDGERQIGMSRAVSDGVTFSWICDVVVDEAYRGQGLGKWMMEFLMSHPRVAPTPMLLVTRDAQALYRQLGFQTHQYECMIKRPSGDS
jgi:ribosomal protein S18 acetylase RimI-like enzyme